MVDEVVQNLGVLAVNDGKLDVARSTFMTSLESRERFFGPRSREAATVRLNLGMVERQLGCPLPNAGIVRNPFNVRYRPSLPWPEAPGLRLAAIGAERDTLFSLARANKISDEISRALVRELDLLEERLQQS